MVLEVLQVGMAVALDLMMDLMMKLLPVVAVPPIYVLCQVHGVLSIR